MSDARRPGPTREQLSELKTLRAYELATEKMVTPRRSAEMGNCGRFVDMGDPSEVASAIGWRDSEIDRLHAEVERMKDIIEHNNDLKYLCDLQAENGGVRAEVERLERYITEIEQDRDGFERACVKALNERDHLLDRVITDEQIDKAWACAADANSYGNDAGLVALAEAGIVECPECEGEGRVMDAVICDRCEGHKWIREEK